MCLRAASLLVFAILAPRGSGQLRDHGVDFTRPQTDRTAWSSSRETLGGRLAEFIGHARSSVRLAMLRLDLPEVVVALAAAHFRGVHVRVLTDDDIRAFRYPRAYRELTASGVPVATDRGEPFNVNVHHKFCVVDDTWVWTGDWNATEEDTHGGFHAAFYVRSRGLAGDFARQFDRLFAGKPAGVGSPAAGAAKPHDLASEGTVRAHFGFADDLSAVCADEILRARERVDIAHLVFNDERVARAVLEVTRRGVKVRVACLEIARKPRIREQLARFGILEAGPTASKIILIDDVRLVTGSYNCTRDVDHENLVVLEGHAGIVEPYRRYVDTLFRNPRPFFLPDGHGDLDATARERREILRRADEGVPAPGFGPGPEFTGRGQVSPSFVLGRLPLEPVEVAFRPSEMGSLSRRVWVRLARCAVSPPSASSVRFVVSTGSLNESVGNFLTPRMTPFVIGPGQLREVGPELWVPFLLEFPEPGVFRMELDGFLVDDGGPPRWIASWRLPPLVHIVSQARVDDVRGVHPVRAFEAGDWTLRRAERRGSEIHGTQSRSALDSARIELDPRECPVLVIDIASTADIAIDVRWFGSESEAGEIEEILVPLVNDGKRHTYLLELGGDRRWTRHRMIHALGLRFGTEGRGTRLFAAWCGAFFSAGKALSGSVLNSHGDLVGTLKVNGTTGDASRRVWCAKKTPITIDVLGMPGSKEPVPFLLFVCPGVPALEDAVALAPLGVEGELSFRPRLFWPSGTGWTLGDALGLDAGALLRCAPAPFRMTLPVPVSGVSGTFTLQAVYFGTPPRVSNAVSVVLP